MPSGMKKVEYRSKTEGPVGLKYGFPCLPIKLVLIDINRYQPGESVTACFLVDLQARKILDGSIAILVYHSGHHMMRCNDK